MSSAADTLPSADDLATAVRIEALESLDPDDLVRYKRICVDFHGEKRNNDGDLDLFTYAAHLPSTVQAWKPFLVKLRQLGRFQLQLHPHEDAKVKQQRTHEAFADASLMGKVIGPAITRHVFPRTILRGVPNQDQAACLEVCRALLANISAEEKEIKKAESLSTLNDAIGQCKAAGRNLQPAISSALLVGQGFVVTAVSLVVK